MHIKHSVYGFDFEIPDVLQGQLEAWEREMESVNITIGDIRLSIFSGIVVRAAIRVGWIPPEVAKLEDIDKMNPGVIIYLSRKISELVSDAREIPPE